MSKIKRSVTNAKGTRRRKSKKESIVEDSAPEVATSISEDTKLAEILDQSKGPQAYCEKKLEFMKYVSTSGLKVAIVRSIVALYEQPVRPKDPLKYISYLLGGEIPTDLELKADQQRVLDLRQKIEELEQENSSLHERIRQQENKLTSPSQEMVEDEVEKESSPEIELYGKDSCDFDLLTAGSFKW